MVKYELRLMFEWGGAAGESVIWGMNDAAKEKFGGYDIKLDNLPISVSMKEELMRLHEWHDSALNWEYPPDPSPWSTKEKDRFLKESVQAFQKLREELGSDYHVVYDAFDYKQVFE